MVFLLVGSFWSGCGWLDEHVDDGPVSCADLCNGRECGWNDGCECGSCGMGETCNFANKCESTVDCDSVCIGHCGYVYALGCDCDHCEAGLECGNDNTCVDCAWKCDAAGAECGNVDGCNCGGCPTGSSCAADGLCECVPNCTGQLCGDDGCGGECGECEFGGCLPDNTCPPCAPQCEELECGPDGCGGYCGPCEPGELCYGELCEAPCAAPVKPFSGNLTIVESLALGEGSAAGEALDVDEDSGTCSPAYPCEDGQDNKTSEFLEQMSDFVAYNSEMPASPGNDGRHQLLELPAPFVPGAPITVHLYRGKPTPGCDVEATSCPVLVDAHGLDPESCAPRWKLEGETTSSELTAGGPGNVVPWPVHIGLFQPVVMHVHNFAIAADVELGDGGKVFSLQGVIGGAFRLEVALEAWEKLPEEAWTDLGFSKEMVQNLLEMFLAPDIDTDSDGLPDAISFGQKFTAGAATAAGLYSPVSDGGQQ